MSSKIDFDSLLLLTNAKCESDIQLILEKHIDVQSMPISVSQSIVNQTKQLLNNCDNDLAVIELITNLSKLCYHSLKTTDLSNDSLNELFPQTFHKQLKQILIKLINKNSDIWLKNSKPIQSMPSLMDFECKIQSNNCVIDLDISDRKDKVSVVLNKQQIKDMTEGMAIIRQQLFEASVKTN